jgi:hypothetical protein
MLSILIPVYNYNVIPLVLELQQQCIAAEIRFEILCQDDCSSLFIEENQIINELSNCVLSRNSINLGRGKNRNTLIQKANYEWLLFLDADTFPKDNNFIKNYLSFIHKPMTPLTFGGIIYHPKKPHPTQMLRWVYGQKRETLSCEFRNKKPNSRALTSNLLVQKEIAVNNPFPESMSDYGYEDLCFLSGLGQQNISVFHIDNPTFHCNLETSAQFLSKTEIALNNLTVLIQANTIQPDESKIVATYLLVKKLHLVQLMAWLFQQTKTVTTKNLLSKNPSLVLFDWYKLGYLCLLQTLK